MTSDPDMSLTADAYPSLRAGEQLREVRDDHLFIVTTTNAVGLNTGRRRYRVVCRTCRLVVHVGTTWPRVNMEYHLREVIEYGEGVPFPGTSTGVDA